MNYPAFVYRELRKRGYEADTLLSGTTLTEDHFQDPNTRVEFATLRRFILNAIETTGDIHLGPRLALHFEANYIGPPAYAAINAPRLADGLEVFGRFVHLTFPAIEFAFPSKGESLSSGEACVCLRPMFQLGDIAYFVTSSALLGLNSLLKNMLRMPLVASRCEVTISEPRGWAEISKEITRVPVRFDAPENRIIFPTDLLDRALPGADPINHKRLVGLCEQFSAQTGTVTTPVCQVVSFLEGANNLGASLSEAATALGYSDRGLRRQLERSGVSYRRLVEQLQERRARDMLANTSQSIHIIAHELGYETPSNFARSFKRWTGKTPKAFRDESKAAPQAGRK
jgi:AraC-like DNA-binding protein